MRVMLATAMAALTLGLASGPMLAQTSERSPALRSIHMLDPQTGWAVTLFEGALLRTTDGGTQWSDVTPASSSGQTVRVFRVNVLSSLIAWVIPSGPVGSRTTEIFGTIDGGRTWRRSTIQAPSVTSISFINPREGWLVAFMGAYTGHTDVEIYRSADGGETWTKVASTPAPTETSESGKLPSTGGKDAITFLNPTTGWITGGAFHWPILYVTHDGGRTWRNQDLPQPPGLTTYWHPDVRPPKFFTAQNGILPVFYFLHSDAGEITKILIVFHVTRDGGRTWTNTAPLSAPVRPYGALPPVSFADMNHGWVKEGGVLHATRDGGRRWATMRPSPVFADIMQLDFISPNIGWAVRNTDLYGGGPGTFPVLLKTLDGGKMWAPVTYTILR